MKIRFCPMFSSRSFIILGLLLHVFFGYAGSLLLCGCFSPVVVSGGYCLAAVRELLAEVASLVAEHRL